MSELLNVEIFATGTWNGFKFTEDDLFEIMENSNQLLFDGKNKPPVKLGHSKKQILAQEDGQPALGWLENFKVEGDKLVSDIKNIPDVLMKAFDKKLWKQVSVELKHIENFGWFVSGLAVLGADLPAVKTLEDLSAFLSERESNLSPQFNNLSLSFTEPIIKHSGEIMTEPIKKDVDLTELLNRVQVLEAEKAQLEKAQDEFKEKEIDHLFSTKKEEFLKIYQSEVELGRLTPALFSEIEGSVGTQRVDFSEGKSLTLNSELLTKILEEYRKPNDQLFSDQGRSNLADPKKSFSEDNVEDVIVEGINSIMGQTEKSYEEASKVYFSSNPEVAKCYHKFTTKIAIGG